MANDFSSLWGSFSRSSLASDKRSAEREKLQCCLTFWLHATGMLILCNRCRYVSEIAEKYRNTRNCAQLE